MGFHRFIKRQAMTLAELLIVICVIGIISALTIPIIRHAMPNKNDVIQKKMGYLIEQVVAQMFADDTMYPKNTDTFAQGFQNISKVTIEGVDYEGNSKFCKIFASKFNLSSIIDCTDGAKTFTTNDGVEWYVPVSDFNLGSAPLMIDVNGAEGPNCLEGAEGCNKPDRYRYWIKSNGTISLTEPPAINESTYDIRMEVTNPSGGSYCIAKYKEDKSLDVCKSGSANFKNLPRNSRYLIKATPGEGFYTTWQSNQRSVAVLNSDVIVKLEFRPRSTYCIALNVRGCNSPTSKASSCGNYYLYKNCNYVYIASGAGRYRKDADGAYEYVGENMEGGDYNYQCDSSGESMLDGIPTEVSDLIDSSTSLGMYKCGLYTGNYRLNVTPKSNWKIPGATSSGYVQDVNLGSDSLVFSLEMEHQ